MTKLSVLVLIALVFLSCTGSKHFDASKPVTPEIVIAHINARNSRISSFFGEGKLSLDTREYSNTGTIAVKILKPDSLMIEVSGPFGVSVGKGLVTNSTFTFYNGLENSVAQGNTTAKNLQRILRFPIEFRDIVEVLSGTMSVRADSSSPAPVGILQDNTFLVRYKQERMSTEYTIDLSYEAVKRFVRRDENDNIVEDISFRDFRKKAGYYFPHIVSISRPKAEENVVLVYDNILINDANLDFSLKIPKSATRIHF
jgi:hypothetical protein